MSNTHILIIGAGITGLTLAQALQQRNQSNPSLEAITFSIYERDTHSLSRGAGWGLTLHWALEQFKQLLPPHLVDRLHEAYVDKDAVAEGEFGSFKLFNMQTGKNDFLTPPSDDVRNRFAREKLRKLLMDNLDIQVCYSTTLILWYLALDPLANYRALQSGRKHWLTSSIQILEK